MIGKHPVIVKLALQQQFVFGTETNNYLKNLKHVVFYDTIEKIWKTKWGEKGEKKSSFMYH